MSLPQHIIDNRLAHVLKITEQRSEDMNFRKISKTQIVDIKDAAERQAFIAAHNNISDIVAAIEHKTYDMLYHPEKYLSVKNWARLNFHVNIPADLDELVQRHYIDQYQETVLKLLPRNFTFQFEKMIEDDVAVFVIDWS